MMKGIRVLFTVAVATLVASAPALAQRGTTMVAVQGGATLSDFTSTGSAFFSNTRWGGTAGVFIGRTFGRNAQANLDVNWEQKGGGEVRVDYVNIPLTVGGGLVASQGWNVRGYIGIGIGFKVSCKDNLASATIDACDNAKSSEWTLPFGFFFGKWSNSGKFFGIDTRMVVSLSDAFEISSVNNRSLQFRAVLGTKVGR
ncbi:MAG: outer membrane beta-barrel protein [Gemmatimonadota bacterium]